MSISGSLQYNLLYSILKSRVYTHWYDQITVRHQFVIIWDDLVGFLTLADHRWMKVKLWENWPFDEVFVQSWPKEQIYHTYGDIYQFCLWSACTYIDFKRKVSDEFQLTYMYLDLHLIALVRVEVAFKENHFWLVVRFCIRTCSKLSRKHWNLKTLHFVAMHCLMQ